MNCALRLVCVSVPHTCWHIDASAGRRSKPTDSTDSPAAAARDVIGDTRWLTTSSFARYAQPRFTPSSSPPGCSGTTTSAQTAPLLTRGLAESTWSGTSHAPTRWPRRISSVHQRRQGQLQRQRKLRSGPST